MRRRFQHVSAAIATCALTAIATQVAAQQGVSPFGVPEKPSCEAVYAVADVRRPVDCPAGEEFTFCATRTLTDQANLISGEITLFAGAKEGITHPHNEDTTVYAAAVKVTTSGGELDLEEQGLFNSKTQEFAGIETVMKGTGKFEGFSGKLIVAGYAEGKGVILGTLCRE